MTTYAYYNEFDPRAAAWLRELINAGHIAPGYVDERSIKDVQTTDLTGFTQCHFFAGIGGWSLALRLAGWPDSRPVWTGSCPCQPFSVAGRGAGTEDPRHLWPDFWRLIAGSRPQHVFGEQVAGKNGETWLDAVQYDLENGGYTCGAVVTPACGFGAPHQRKRLYWCGVANTPKPHGGRAPGNLAHSECTGSQRQPGNGYHGDEPGREHAEAVGSTPQGCNPGTTNGFWGNAEWIPCKDGTARPIEPGTFPLANGVSGRVGLLRGYGNAIVPQQAQAFIKAFMEYTPGA